MERGGGPFPRLRGAGVDEGLEVTRNRPVVSVIIPTRNRPGMVVRAIRSVLDQEVAGSPAPEGAIEILVVDDASAEETAEAVESLHRPEIRYLRHDRRRGAGAARNTGIEEARSDRLAFLDDDDEWMPQKLALQIEALDESSDDVGAVHCAFEVVSSVTGRVVHTANRDRPHEGTPEAFLRSTGFPTSIPLIKKICFDEAGLFDTSLPGSQDRDMWVRIARRRAFLHVPRVLARHYIHGDQITADLKSKIRAKTMFLRKHGEALASHPDIMADQLERLGMMWWLDGDARKGTACFTKALGLQPARPSALRNIELSRNDPDRYRRHLLESVFKNVDGISLFY